MAREFYSGPGFSFSTEVDPRVKKLHNLNDLLFDVAVGNTDVDQETVDRWDARAQELEAELTREGIAF